VVDSGALGGIEAVGGEAEDGVGQVVEPVTYFFACHVAEGGRGEGGEESERGPEIAAHAGVPWGLGRMRPSAGGRYWSLSAAS
jgi:hypothetical protein